MNLFNLNFAKSWQLLFQDPATPIMEGIIDLHHNIFFFLLLILFLVLYILFSFLDKFYYSWINPDKKSPKFKTIISFSNNTKYAAMPLITPEKIVETITHYLIASLPGILLSIVVFFFYKIYKELARKYFFCC